MRKIRIRLKPENWKYLENALAYQRDNNKYYLDTVEYKIRYLKGNKGRLSKEEWNEELDHTEKLFDRIKSFESLRKKLIGGNGKEIELEELEYTVFLDTLHNQLGHSEARIEDFKEDRFGWGKSNCDILIEDETKFSKVLSRLYKKYKL